MDRFSLKRDWRDADDAALRQLALQRTPLWRIASKLKRTEGSIRARASKLGINVAFKQPPKHGDDTRPL